MALREHVVAHTGLSGSRYWHGSCTRASLWISARGKEQGETGFGGRSACWTPRPPEQSCGQAHRRHHGIWLSAGRCRRRMPCFLSLPRASSGCRSPWLGHTLEPRDSAAKATVEELPPTHTPPGRLPDLLKGIWVAGHASATVRPFYSSLFRDSLL